MDVRENWNQLNQRIKEENETIIPSLFQIHMGAFEDLRKSGHLITANGQPANFLAHILDKRRLILWELYFRLSASF